MQGDFPAFCHRQSTKITVLAEGCTDPVLKDELLEMAAYWQKLTSAPNRPTKQHASDGGAD